jgi:hypothetical protein
MHMSTSDRKAVQKDNTVEMYIETLKPVSQKILEMLVNKRFRTEQNKCHEVYVEKFD